MSPYLFRTVSRSASLGFRRGVLAVIGGVPEIFVGAVALRVLELSMSTSILLPPVASTGPSLLPAVGRVGLSLASSYGCDSLGCSERRSAGSRLRCSDARSKGYRLVLLSCCAFLEFCGSDACESVSNTHATRGLRDAVVEPVATPRE